MVVSPRTMASTFVTWHKESLKGGWTMAMIALEGSERLNEDGTITFSVDRDASVLMLIDRDGWVCQYPGCTLPFDSDPNGKHAVSVDHIYPQRRAKEDNWTYEQIWDLDNLQLMGRSCNARKSDLLYNEDGTLPNTGRTVSVKVPRPQKCDECLNGRLLL